MDDAIAKRDWIDRVLGVDVGAEVSWAGPGQPVLPLWLEAKETVDAGIDQLQRALREDGDAELREIAEFGLNGATNRKSVGMMVALREVDSAPSLQTRDAAIAAVEAFRGFLEAAPIVGVIEDNPFGVRVPMRATLGQALDQIAQALAA